MIQMLLPLELIYIILSYLEGASLANLAITNTENKKYVMWFVGKYYNIHTFKFVKPIGTDVFLDYLGNFRNCSIKTMIGRIHICRLLINKFGMHKLSTKVRFMDSDKRAEYLLNYISSYSIEDEGNMNKLIKQYLGYDAYIDKITRPKRVDITKTIDIKLAYAEILKYLHSIEHA